MYQLKDKDRHQRLDLSLVCFNEWLQRACRLQWDDDSDFVVVEYKNGLDISEYWVVHIPKSEIEVVHEYNPRKWNNFRTTKPPYGMLMRVEASAGRKTCAYLQRFSDGDFWCDPEGTVWPEAFSASVVRFRPWDDEEEEE